MKLVDYPLMFRTCIKLRRQPEKLLMNYQRKYLTESVPDKQKHGYIREKIDEFIQWYDEFTGMDEVRNAQRRVLEDEENFRKSQEERRNILNDLKEVQRKLKDLNTELDNTLKGDDRYVALVTQEHKLLKEEKLISEKFAMAERNERDSFSALSSSVKLSHEKERAQSERTKYWSLIASAVGTVVGILGTSINNHFKMSELKELIKSSSNRELLDNLNHYLEANETLLNNIKSNPKLQFNNNNNIKVEDLLNKIDKKLNKLEINLQKIEQKTGVINSELSTVTDSEKGTVETVAVDTLSEAVTKEYAQMKMLLCTIVFLSILMPLLSSTQYPLGKLAYSDSAISENHKGKDQAEVFFNGFMMKPKVYSEKSLENDQNILIQQFKSPTFKNIYSEDDLGFVLLKDGKSYINNVNDFEMDNLSGHKHDNVSILQNDRLGNDEAGEQDDIVTWNSAALEENWWSICQLPVFMLLFAIIGVLAITFVIILWLKNQMIQSEKNKKIVVLDGNQIQLNSSTCPCPSPNLPTEDRWICHTVISLKNSSEDNQEGSISVQPQAATPLSDVQSSRGEELEKRPEAFRIKTKGLLERRGSSASLTIDLPQGGYESKAHVVTPTRECMNEEFLLSAGNVLSRSQLKNCLKNVQRLHEEFWEIPLNHQEKSMVTGCGTKNRYQSILPNEKTRVKLTESEEPSLDAYINANYIRGYDGEEKAYIATQGPLPNTIQDLYRMAWNEKSPIIVMITKFYEKAKVKCESYFPTHINETATYGDFKVTVISVVKKEGFSVRELLIQNDCDTRRILHYWYDSWPDHKTPQNAHTIVDMAVEIKNCRESFRNKSLNNNDNQSSSCGPVIVHCSAGIGRTGCFIAISLAICQLLEEDKVDVLGIVCQMRCDRGGMIQTAEQYEFVHRAVALFEHSLPESSAE